MAALTQFEAGEISTARLGAQIDGALRTLAASTDPAEIVSIHGMAEVIRYAVKRAKLGLETQNHAAELRLRAERRLGEILRQRVARGRPRAGEIVEAHDIFRLDDFGISPGFTHQPGRGNACNRSGS